MPVYLRKFIATISLLAALIAPGMLWAYGGATINTNAKIPGNTICNYELYHSSTDQAAAVLIYNYSIQPEAAGGEVWDNSALDTTYDGVDDGKVSTSPVSVSSLETYCGFTDVTIVSQTGASVSYAADSYVGVTFRAVADDGKYYEYEYALSGVSSTTGIATQTLIPTAPTADAGGDQTVASGATVNLDGTGSFANFSGRSIVSYSWTQDIGSSTDTVTLSGAGTATPSFTAPTLVAGSADATIVINLVVNDGTEDSAADSVTITVEAPTDTAPTADAGPDQTVASGASVDLDGTGSSANDVGQSLTYAWTQTSGSAVTLTGDTTATPSFTAPVVPVGDPDEILIFSLVVNDGLGDSAASTVQITVSALTDLTRPTVTVSAASDRFAYGESFDVKITFSEPVSGFAAGDIMVTNGSAQSLTGDGTVFSAEISPSDGAVEVSVSVPENVAADAAANLNEASNTLTLQANMSEITNLVASRAMTMRARALINSLPDLSAFLTGSPENGLSVSTRDARTDINFSVVDTGRLWVFGQGQNTRSGGEDGSFYALSFGTHLYRRENLIIGAMVAADRFTSDMDEAGFDGDGWMAGPYVVAHSPNHPLVFSARYLFGRSANTVTFDGLSPQDFDATRRMATAGVQGSIGLSDDVVLSPSLDVAHFVESQGSYVNNQGDTVAAHKVRLTEASFGLSLSKTIDRGGVPLVLSGGVDGIYSRTRSLTERSGATRARVTLGTDVPMDSGGAIRLGAFYDGLGQSGYQAAGANILINIAF